MGTYKHKGTLCEKWSCCNCFSKKCRYICIIVGQSRNILWLQKVCGYRCYNVGDNENCLGSCSLCTTHKKASAANSWDVPLFKGCTSVTLPIFLTAIWPRNVFKFTSHARQLYLTCQTLPRFDCLYEMMNWWSTSTHWSSPKKLAVLVASGMSLL